MATTTFYCTSNSANIRSENATYLTARSGGTLTLDTPMAVAGQRFVAGPTYRCYNGFVEFDFTSIAGATVSAASLYVSDTNSGGGWQTAAEFRVRALDYGASVTTGDYVAGASLSALTLLAHISSIVFVDNNLHALSNDGLVTAVQGAVGSTLRCILTTDRLEAGTTPTQFEYMETPTTGGTSSQNFQIDVTYTFPSTAKLGTLLGVGK